MSPEEARKLDANEKWKAFKAGKQMQWKYDDGQWADEDNLEPQDFLTFPDRIRVKPEPRVPRRSYFINKKNTPLHGYQTREKAESELSYYNSIGDFEIVEIVEVLKDGE